MTFANFFINHAMTIILTTVIIGFISMTAAFLMYPKWRKKTMRAMRRGMADTSPSPFVYVPFITAATLILMCALTAGSDESDWVTEKTETVALSCEAQIRPHTENGERVVSVVDGSRVYVFKAGNIKVSTEVPTKLEIEYRKAFLRPGYTTAVVR